MPLPLLGVAAAARILGPVALKAAKSAYKLYKKNKGKKTEKKFISDKAMRKKADSKANKKADKAINRAFDDDKTGGGDGGMHYYDDTPFTKATRLQKKKGDIATYNRIGSRKNLFKRTKGEY